MSADRPTDSAPVAPKIDGWEAKYIGDEPRLSEQVELFGALGFETMTKVLDPAECEGCTECFKDSPTPVMVLYVRRKEGGDDVAGDDELF